MSLATPLLKVTALRKSFGSQVAVAHVDLEIQAGTCFGLLGPNGAGKTTLIGMITGSLEADGGTATLGGQPIGVNRFEVKQRIGYVPQDLALYEDLSSFENLRFFGMVYGLSGAELKDRIRRALELAGLEDRSRESVRTFSGGMKRRLNIASALLHDPVFLVLDEPTVGVDPQSRNLIFEALERLVSEGKTILYTTHYMEEVERLCSRAAIMDLGRVIAEGELSDLHRLAPVEKTVEIKLDVMPAASFEALPGVAVVDRSRSTLSLQLEDLTRDLPRVLSSVEESGGRIASISTAQASLEQVFLHLTGVKRLTPGNDVEQFVRFNRSIIVVRSALSISSTDAENLVKILEVT